MDKIYCSKCGKANSVDASFCNGCGAPIARIRQPKQSGQSRPRPSQQSQSRPKPVQARSSTSRRSSNSVGNGTVIMEVKKMIPKEDFSTRITRITKPKNLWYLIGIIASFTILVSMFLPFLSLDMYFYKTNLSMFDIMEGGISIAIVLSLIFAVATMISSFLRFGLGNIVCGFLGAFFGLIILANIFFSSTFEGLTPGIGLILFVIANVAVCLSGVKIGLRHLKKIIHVIKNGPATQTTTNTRKQKNVKKTSEPVDYDFEEEEDEDEEIEEREYDSKSANDDDFNYDEDEEQDEEDEDSEFDKEEDSEYSDDDDFDYDDDDEEYK